MYEYLTCVFYDDNKFHRWFLKEAVGEFVRNYPIFEDSPSILKKAGVKLDDEYIQSLDARKLSCKTLAALIVYWHNKDDEWSEERLSCWLYHIKDKTENRKLNKKRIAEFNRKLESIVQMTFCYGPAFYCTSERVVRFVVDVGDSQAVISGIHAYQDSVLWSNQIDKQQFLSDITGFNIWRWRRSYSDPYIDDGEVWDMSFTFGDQKRTKYWGVNAYPNNFEVVKTYFGKYDSESFSRK